MNRKQILEGIKNKVFTDKDVELIAAKRLKICESCTYIDRSGDHCLVPGTKPCCSLCGCDLSLKTRSLSSECADEENTRWEALLTEEEEDEFTNNQEK